MLLTQYVRSRAGHVKPTMLAAADSQPRHECVGQKRLRDSKSHVGEGVHKLTALLTNANCSSLRFRKSARAWCRFRWLALLSYLRLIFLTGSDV